MFPLDIYLSALVSAWFATLGAMLLWRRWCQRTGLVDDPGHRKIHDHPVPLAGGLAVMSGLLIPLFLAAFALWSEAGDGSGLLAQWRHSAASLTKLYDPLGAGSSYPLEYGLSHRTRQLGGILLGALGMLLVGLLDDQRELRPAPKFGCQFLIAALVAGCGVRITLFVPNLLFHYAITILWILAVVNAFNFMDNLNGLCAGLGAIAALCFAAIAAADGHYLVTVLALLTVGALLGFLPYNFPNGRVFLGDSGSHLVGYLLAVLAILPHFYMPGQARHWAVLIPLFVLAVLRRGSRGPVAYAGALKMES